MSATLPNHGILSQMPHEDRSMAAYVQALRKHDWSFEMSDDHAVYLSGRSERVELDRLQADLDPEFVVWNEFAPKGYKS